MGLIRRAGGFACEVAAWTAVFVTVQDCVVGVAGVAGDSMQPTLQPAALVLAEKVSARLYRHRRGDVVLLRSPMDHRKLLCKRLLALEGDWLLVPGREEVVKVPKGACWVEGDNPARSRDSRTDFGPVPVALIDSRVTHVLWPRSAWGRVRCRDPATRLLSRNAQALTEPARYGD